MFFHIICILGAGGGGGQSTVYCRSSKCGGHELANGHFLTDRGFIRNMKKAGDSINHIFSKFIQIKWDYLECLNALPSG
jgi:hypothetical protein